MHVAILGATGAVGRTFLRVLEGSRLPVDRLTLLASERSAGTRLSCRGREWSVGAVRSGAFRGVDVALFSAGAERSLEWAPRAVDEGAVVVDNSSAWRMDPDVPLVVPEVNGGEVSRRPRGIVANPNCSTIQMVVPLAALHRAVGLRRVMAVTFQAASGAGESGRRALERELVGEQPGASPFARRLAGNVVPQIGDLGPDGWTGEEEKMREETRKILGLPDLPVAATCVRVPVLVGHSVQLAAELSRPLDRDALQEVLAGCPGVAVAPRPEDYPTPAEMEGEDGVGVGRLRVDRDDPRIVHLWVVADNLRKGAATNTVQIAERIADG